MADYRVNIGPYQADFPGFGYNVNIGSDQDDGLVPPEITDQSGSRAECYGQIVNLFVTATGDPAPTYQWYKDDQIMSGEINSTLSFYASTAAIYKCKVSNVVGDVWSDSIVVTITPNPYCYNLFNLQLDMSRTD